MTIKVENLRRLFDPLGVAVIGASKNPGKLGYHVMKSLTEGGFQGAIFPVNPGEAELFGMQAYPSIADVPEDVDLAIVVLPAQAVPDMVRQCSDKRVKGIVLITAGFKEIEDEQGAQLQEEITRLANEAGTPIIGPNTFGMVNLHQDLNASFTPEFSRVRKGGVSLISQSGGMAHMLAFLALEQNVGFAKIIGVGNRCNLGFAELLEYLAEDETTRVIAMYMEGVDDPHRLMQVARGVRGTKPVVVYKVGRSEVSDRASQFHTGSLAGQYKVYQGAFRQTGMLAVHSLEELLDAAKALDTCPLPEGNRVAVLSGQAGPGMAACDVCEEMGLALATFSEETQARINAALPPLALRSNPVDMGPAWYSPQAIAEVADASLGDPNVDGVVLCIAYASANIGAVESLSGVLKSWASQKPITCCLSAPGELWQEGIRSLEEAGVPNYPAPERAATALGNLWRCRSLAKGTTKR
ncbi:MAG TPA: CoA-binding protein [Anaerolineae bacterium]|nr:CoA-binding protein [Anaerolineae bacterium]